MSGEQMNVHERNALREVSHKMGEWLDQVDLSTQPMAEWEPEAWTYFLAMTITEFQAAMKAQLETNEAPF